MDNCCEKHHGSNFLLGLIIGGALGALAVALTSTKEGKKLVTKARKQGERLLEDVEEEIVDKKEEVLEKLDEIKDEVDDKVEEIKDNVSQAVKKEVDIISHDKRLRALEGKGKELADKIGSNFFARQGKKKS